MKTRLYILLTIALITLTITAVSEGSDNTGMRTWTDTDGNTLEASFVKELYGSIYLKRANGRTTIIKKSKLSASDLEIAKELKTASTTKPRTIKKKNEEPELKKAPEELYDLFGSKLKTGKKKSATVDQLTDKVIGIYFSAHWCPPCRAFTPQLVKFYNELKKNEKPFEIVFVSSDRDRAAMYSYMKEMKMPWLALPHGDKRKGALSSKFNVSGIPKLVILNSKGELITENGRGEVPRGPSVYDKWAK